MYVLLSEVEFNYGSNATDRTVKENGGSTVVVVRGAKDHFCFLKCVYIFWHPLCVCVCVCIVVKISLFFTLSC